MEEVIRRFRVSKMRGKWYVFTTARVMQGKWHYLNEYDTHTEALDGAIKAAETYTIVLRRLRHRSK